MVFYKKYSDKEDAQILNLSKFPNCNRKEETQKLACKLNRTFGAVRQRWISLRAGNKESFYKEVRLNKKLAVTKSAGFGRFARPAFFNENLNMMTKGAVK